MKINSVACNSAYRLSLAGLLVIILAWTAAAHADPATGPSTLPSTFPSPSTTPSAPPAPAPAETTWADLTAAAQYRGQTVESVRIMGNQSVSTAVIQQLIRTHEGDKFDPDIVVSDYERIADSLKIFKSVEARVQPTQTGVIVLFVVEEQSRIRDIRYEGNIHIPTTDLQKAVDLKAGQAVDPFRINLAEQAVQKCYDDKCFPLARVSSETDDTQCLIFHIIEGPQTKVRKIDFIGNNSFSAFRLRFIPHDGRSVLKSQSYFFLFNEYPVLSDETINEDIGSLTHYYQDHGFFDARVGRKITRSADMTMAEVTYLIDEGPRYVIDNISFTGLHAVTTDQLRQAILLHPGVVYDADAIETAKKSIVGVYSKVGGYVYVEDSPGTPTNPDYLRIDCQTVYHAVPGKVDLIFSISEGKQFRVGRILIHGNANTKDNVVLREMHLLPGQEYDAAEVLAAQDRLRGLKNFEPNSVTIIPVGDDPTHRDLLVDVHETHTADIAAGVGVNSNGGFGGQLSFEQKNFDIGNPPTTWADLLSDRAWAGAGQDFKVYFAPGTLGTDAGVTFTEPYLYDSPYSFSGGLSYDTRIREVYNDDRLQASTTYGRRFGDIYGASLTFLCADVNIKDLLQPPSDRAPEIVDGLGHHSLTSIRAAFTRDTTNHGPIIYQGTKFTVSGTDAGAMGGQVDYDRIETSFSAYQDLGQDLLGRHYVLSETTDWGDDPRHAPFYDRYYLGGFGSVRGFEYRGISPRSGPEDDQIGGDAWVTGSTQYSYPIFEDMLRGEFFMDAGDVEATEKIGTVRTAVGFGFTISLPFLGQNAFALDFGFPITKTSQDNTEVISFSAGISR